MNPHKAILGKSNERGPKRKNSNVGIRCEKVKQRIRTRRHWKNVMSGVLRERIRMWEYDVKKVEQRIAGS